MGKSRWARGLGGAWLAAWVAGAGALPGQEPDGAPGAVDDVRPDPGWTVQTLAGETFTLGEFRGRPVFVNLWATWCPPCVAELASIDRLAAAVGDDVAFLLVSPEDEAPVRAFLRRRPLAVEPVLERTLAPEALGAEALPHTVILDASGRIVLKHRGAAAWDTPEVEALLRSLVPPRDRRPEP
ncbi:MAG: TlpA disulfide reductase family protein, partial [Longimicrobiales bacterium]